MSHEGIRIAPREQRASESEAERPLARIAVTPAKVRVLVTEGKGMEIDWADGHRSVWSFAWLRQACPCATCVEERKLEGRKPGQPKARPSALLPMYTPPAKPASAHTSAATPSSSTGRTATPAASTPGITCAAPANAANVPLLLKKQPARRTSSCPPG